MIRLDNVTCGYGGSPVLSRVSLSIAEGETVMITGPNGAGKSTMLRVLAGLLAPSKGDVDYGWPEGRDPRHLTGYLPDSTCIYRSLKVNQLERLHRESYGLPRSHLPLLEKASISESARIGELSAGHRVLVHLSLILSTRPRLILLDEVLNTVDPYLRDLALQEIVTAMADTTPAVVMVNLVFGETAPLAERVVFLDYDGIKLDEPVDQLRRNPLVQAAGAEKGIPGMLTELIRIAHGERRNRQ